MNANAFRTRLGLLAEATSKELTEPLVALWWQKYGGVEERLLDLAFDRAIETCEFFPSPARFNAFLAELRGPERERHDEGLRLKRSALAHGFAPANWSAERLAGERAALGLDIGATGLAAGGR